MHVLTGGSTTDMDNGHQYTAMTDAQREHFDQYGYLVIEDALPPAVVAELNEAIDEVHERHRKEGTLGKNGDLNLRNCIVAHDDFLQLLDWPSTVPLAWGALNWNIQMITSHLIVLPSGEEPTEEAKRGHGMHRDGGTSFVEMQEPHPRILLKIAYVLSDQTDPASGATSLVPGSNRITGQPPTDPATGWPYGAIQMNLPAGSAFMFEQRTFHSIGANWCGHDRRTIFMGYAYRWVKPMDYIQMPERLVDRCSPLQKQLIGEVSDALSYYLPEDEDVPLKSFLAEK
ncbi:MAG: phytanoyl-CoA dioxygenase family protein [Gemmatimonadetes bacterium]|nr:phytanoyl-CoA dioxygenase family protein [Gemmatimonadota bacterium]MYG15769.1 phytanoyl-CoA dioxygenase family protein [Gemmatimonadota bacterium]